MLSLLSIKLILCLSNTFARTKETLIAFLNHPYHSIIHYVLLFMEIFDKSDVAFHAVYHWNMTLQPTLSHGVKFLSKD